MLNFLCGWDELLVNQQNQNDRLCVVRRHLLSLIPYNCTSLQINYVLLSVTGRWRPARDSSLHWLCSSWWGQCSPRDHLGQGSPPSAQPPPGSLLSPSLLDRQSPRSRQTSPHPSLAHPQWSSLTAPENVYAPRTTPMLSTVRTGTSVWSRSSHLEPTTCTCRTTTSEKWRQRRSSTPLRSAGSTWPITAFIE